MGILKFNYSITDTAEQDYYLPLSEYKMFGSSILNLGEISKDGQYFEALAAVFDLEGFTMFCTQIDPHLVIPEFLNGFLNWLFETISNEFVQKSEDDQVILWCQLPFFAKFMGDGVLFLWDTRDVAHEAICNIVVSLSSILTIYVNSFYSAIRKSVSRAPQKLRCGIARGQIISIGDGNDFVGPCINVASRLQKLKHFTFAFSKRGFNLERGFDKEIAEEFILIESHIRGVGEEELIYVLKSEFNTLTNEEKLTLQP